MVATVRGGHPIVKRVTASTTGQQVSCPFFLLWLKVRNGGANVGRLYFTEDDYTNNANFVEIPVAAATHPYGEWEGPVETSAGTRNHIWVRGVGGDADLEIVLFQRRG